MSKYDDIINLPHHVSPTRKPMPMEVRAAQFAPFAALNGHEDAINETARLTDARTELSPDEQKQLSLTLSLALAKDAEVLVTYFLPDPFKSGGRYVQRRGRIKKLNEYDHTLRMQDGTLIPMPDITALHILTLTDYE